MNRLLLILLIAAAASAAYAAIQLRAAAEQATLAGQELADCRRFLADPVRRAAAAELGLIASSSATAAARGGATDMESRIRQASGATGVAEQLSSVEIADAAAVADGDRAETKVFLHFDAMTLEELTRFLHHLADAHPDSRTYMIELDLPSETDIENSAGNVNETVERWAADITVAYRQRSIAAGWRR